MIAIDIPKPMIHLTPRTEEIEEKYQAIAKGEDALVSRAHGKIFIKFSQIIAAKKARYMLSGRTYNGRTVAGAFYPEHLFDRNELNL